MTTKNNEMEAIIDFYKDNGYSDTESAELALISFITGEVAA